MNLSPFSIVRSLCILVLIVPLAACTAEAADDPCEESPATASDKPSSDEPSPTADTTSPSAAPPPATPVDSSLRPRAGCPSWMCGTNHNRRLLRAG